MDKINQWIEKNVKDVKEKKPGNVPFKSQSQIKSQKSQNQTHKKSNNKHQHASDQHASDQHASDQHASDQHASDQHTSNQHTSNQHTSNQHTSNQHVSNQHHYKKFQNSKTYDKKTKLRVVPLGGLEEVGKNMMYFEYGNNIVVIDMGLQFPEEDMLGIDYVIPDVSSLIPKKHNIKGILISHGHLDHIGAIPHLLPRLGFPTVYGTKLTIGLIQKRLEEFDLLSRAKLQVIDYDTVLKLGCFTAEFFRVNHSIPDAAGIFLNTPVGNIVHSGDFKFDFTPPDKKPADFGKIARFGDRGILAAFIESTNANKPGKTISEKVITENLDNIIRDAKGRILIASFSTLIGRMQAVIVSCMRHNRKIFVSGRSMVDNIEIAQKLGYIKAPKGMIRKLSNNINNLPNNQILVLTTGSQGETMSALTRMSLGEHTHLKLRESDTVVLSSSPIQGNERAIQTVINNLCRLRVKVIYNALVDVHTSGHAHAEDLKLMYTLLKPKFLVPIHGFLYMRMAHQELITGLGLPQSRTALLENGDILEFFHDGIARKSKQKISANNILIDGLGVGDVGTRIICERKTMAHNGVVVVLLRVYDKSGHLVADPGIISRGFLYVKESREIANETLQRAKKAYNDAIGANPKISMEDLKHKVKMGLSGFFRKRLAREPMILPVIVRV